MGMTIQDAWANANIDVDANNEAMNDIYEATNELRYVLRRDPIDFGTQKVLQQKWFGVRSGAVDWRDVPICGE